MYVMQTYALLEIINDCPMYLHDHCSKILSNLSYSQKFDFMAIWYKKLSNMIVQLCAICESLVCKKYNIKKSFLYCIL